MRYGREHIEDQVVNSHKVVGLFEIEEMIDREEGLASILPN